MSISPPAYADARSEGPQFRGEDVPHHWGMLAANRYEVFFDKEFPRGTMLRSYDGNRYYRMNDIEESYCTVDRVEKDRFAACRSFGPGFPYKTVLKLIVPVNPNRYADRPAGRPGGQ